ncbi:nucleotidyl transferase AbiEii/AbiGii toxin family protein [Mesorhizobium temperatum]|uniref:nucleotidyl transferase AbiEii/AbiGii toxin family protein n=1 Tax=Mesorhizobium temperatum TaxID=241416 RepID=UPI001FD88AFD|nr:nucleotidyl transferase AbiEii/AbiGii toxin family protein [Mesorhizobium temperatum]
MLDASAPRLHADPETAVAEKFEALVTLDVANSRIKDFYDLWMIGQSFQFDLSLLSSALRHT